MTSLINEAREFANEVTTALQQGWPLAKTPGRAGFTPRRAHSSGSCELPKRPLIAAKTTESHVNPWRMVQFATSMRHKISSDKFSGRWEEVKLFQWKAREGRRKTRRANRGRSYLQEIKSIKCQHTYKECDAFSML